MDRLDFMLRATNGEVRWDGKRYVLLDWSRDQLFSGPTIQDVIDLWERAQARVG